MKVWYKLDDTRSKYVSLPEEADVALLTQEIKAQRANRLANVDPADLEVFDVGADQTKEEPLGDDEAVSSHATTRTDPLLVVVPKTTLQHHVPPRTPRTEKRQIAASPSAGNSTPNQYTSFQGFRHVDAREHRPMKKEHDLHSSWQTSALFFDLDSHTIEDYSIDKLIQFFEDNPKLAANAYSDWDKGATGSPLRLGY